MKISTCTFIFSGIVLVFALSATQAEAQATTQTITPSASELQKLNDFVAALNADLGFVRKTLKRHTGELIDCVDYDKQPAFRRLRKASQQVPPMATLNSALAGTPNWVGASTPEPLLDPSDTFPSTFEDVPAAAAKTCDVGTVPIVRKDLEELKKFPTLNAYLNSVKVGPRTPPFNPPGSGLLHAGIEDQDSLLAIQANFNHQLPYIGVLGDHSTLQFAMLKSGNSIEMGLDVDPYNYNEYSGNTPSNYRVHTMAYVGRDHSASYCYFGLYCQGINVTYHQQSNVYFPGQAWYPQAGSESNYVGMGIVSGSVGGQDMWAYCVFGQIMGWVYKSEAQVTGSVAVAHVYGEVGSYGMNATTTTMGSGYYAYAGWPYAAWAGNIQVFRSADGFWSDYAIQGNTPCFNDDSNCYNIAAYDVPHGGLNCFNLLSSSSSPWPGWGTFMYYGGPGANTSHYPNTDCN